jgi:hypothetical protein
MKPLLAAALLCVLTLTARAECYVSQEDPMWTLTEGEISIGQGFIWKQGDKTVELSTGGIGTGIIARQASEENGRIHTYLFVGNVLVFDMSPYDPGCADVSKKPAPPPDPAGFDALTVMKIYEDAGYACSGRTRDDRGLSPAEAHEQCLVRIALGEQLKRYGYCWVFSELEWQTCPTK